MLTVRPIVTALAFILGALIPKFLERHAQVVTNAFVAWLVLSLRNNLFATSTFAYTLWAYCRYMSCVGLGSRQPTRAQKILTVIVESGVICFVIQRGLAVVQFPNAMSVFASGSHLARRFVERSTCGACVLFGMYPTIVVVLVAQQRTKAETFPASRTLL
ncbi:hypothetical protein LshimejAT787_0201080 [Lyophyllum shimeji]|uniref:Uncharacterized protein n=1 Tax=Lyophyllum shimeji TaxID=47721 RepID=A0A9P3PEP8_LYOSH|nr:hypothetical protein LshimejAT787_0201080 [Lyophyllum shimeji]